MTINRVQLVPLTCGSALDHCTDMFGKYSPQSVGLAPQLAASRYLRALKVNGHVVALGGVVPLDNGTVEGFLVLRPDWTPTPRLMILAARRIRAAVLGVSRHHDLIVHVRTRSGARLARIIHLTYLRMIRLHDIELEVWGRGVLGQNTGKTLEAAIGSTGS